VEDPVPKSQGGSGAAGSISTSLLERVKGRNWDYQGKQKEQLRQLYENPNKGVEAQKAF
jgi:hypothetical protein